MNPRHDHIPRNDGSAAELARALARYALALARQIDAESDLRGAVEIPRRVRAARADGCATDDDVEAAEEWFAVCSEDHRFQFATTRQALAELESGPNRCITWCLRGLIS